MADSRLASDVVSQLNSTERAYAVFAQDAPGAAGASNLRGAQILDRKIVSKPDASGKWAEDWTVKRDSGSARYRINFIPTPDIGGTGMTIEHPPTLLK